MMIAAMILDTIAHIEARIAATDSIPAEQRQELLQLLETLREEMSKLSKEDQESAQSIAGFAQVSAHEAMRKSKDPELLNLSLKGFGSSVDGFEQSHPKLVQIVNSISHTLSNLGI